MKTKSIKPFFLKTILIVILVFFSICGFTNNNFGSDKQINAQNSKKVAILIIRVGNTQAFSPMTRISLKTDYAIRVPKLGTDVFIDNDKRLLESVPTYPKYTGNTNEYYIEYFRNITPDIFNGVKSGFKQKGYEVFDMKKLSETWSKPFSEMTVKEIISATENNVDFLFILHYMDIGNSNVNSKFHRIKATHSGFTSLIFSYSMFDIQKQKKLFSYSPLLGFASIPAIIYNPEIMNNPDLRKRITVNCQKEFDENTTYITHNFTDNELIKLLINNILNGFQCYGKKFIDCYDECSSLYDIKGLLSKIP